VGIGPSPAEEALIAKIDEDVTPGKAPSHPAFYLHDQELEVHQRVLREAAVEVSGGTPTPATPRSAIFAIGRAVERIVGERSRLRLGPA
jgi:hypothetical protein